MLRKSAKAVGVIEIVRLRAGIESFSLFVVACLERLVALSPQIQCNTRCHAAVLFLSRWLSLEWIDGAQEQMTDFSQA